MAETTYKYRQLARLVIEAKSPLAVGSGQKDIMSDSHVATDINGLPYIPGTSIAGIFRSMIEEADAKDIFGYQERDKGLGSRIIFSEGKIMNSENKVIDGLDERAAADPLLCNYFDLPVRQHVRINDSGTTDDAGKFDGQVVFAGTRFCFEVEMLSDSKSDNQFKAVMAKIHDRMFRLGGGTRKGYGEIGVVTSLSKVCSLDLSDPNDLRRYLDKSSDLRDPNDWWKDVSYECDNSQMSEDKTTTYTLRLTAKDFVLFGSGMGDMEGFADMTPVAERCVVDAPEGKRQMSDKPMVLVPGSSVKGAIAHRVAFHYNCLNKWFAGNANAKVGDDNQAVRALFGNANSADRTITRGKVMISDCMLHPVAEKLINHVAIDHFTGGAIEGALFTEKATSALPTFELKVTVENSAFADDENIRKAIESALKDICNGHLPLGGGVNRGNGVFTGSMEVESSNNE